MMTVYVVCSYLPSVV